jgi:mRNA interferase MazF
MVNGYIPAKGDIVMLNFSPTVGHEQDGKRPALVLSPKNYHRKTGMMIACPITSKIKGYNFEVKLSPEQKIHGVVLVDHIRSIDFTSRNIEFVEESSSATLQKVQAIIKGLITT